MASALLCGAFFTACDDNDEKPVFPENQENVYDMSGFAKGADVSWLTEMEKQPGQTAGHFPLQIGRAHV